MEAIEVTAKFGADGKIEPVSLRWQDREQRVEAIGRRWQAEDGLHFLVILPGGQGLELRFAPAEQRWYLVRAQPETRAA